MNFPPAFNFETMDSQNLISLCEDQIQTWKTLLENCKKQLSSWEYMLSKLQPTSNDPAINWVNMHLGGLSHDAICKLTLESLMETISNYIPEGVSQETVGAILDKYKNESREIVRQADEATMETPVVKRTYKKKTPTKTPQTPTDGESSEGSVKEKKKRGPSAYNLFIKAEIERLRLEDPTINHKVAMSMAVAAWKSKDKTEEPIPESIPESITLENSLCA